MHNSILTAVLAGLGGMLGWGSADFFAKKTVDKLGPIKSLVWAHLGGTACLVLAVLGQILLFGRAVHFPVQASAWVGVAFFGVLQMIVYWLAYQAFEKGQLSILNPIFASYSGLVALSSVVLFGEKLRLILGLALLAIFLGNLLLNLDFDGFKLKRKQITPGLPEILGATLLAAIWTLGWNKYVSGRDSVSVTLLMYAFMSLAAFVLARLARVKLRLERSKTSDLIFLGGIGLGEAVAYLAITWGYSSTNRTSIVALISGAFAVPTLILARAFLDERLNRLQALAIVILIAGVVLVSVNQ